MRIGVSLSSSLGPGPGDTPHTVAARMIERAAVAHRAGLSSLTVGDHHAMPGFYQQNTPILGRLLAEWTARPAGCLFLLPLWSPVLVAEHIGTLAGLVDAPFIVQTGIGRGADQFASMGADHGRRGAVTDEALRVITGLLAGERMESPMLGVGPTRLGLRPEQPVEWWIGGHAPAALRRAAHWGHAWYAGPGLADHDAAQLVEAHRVACAEAGVEARAIVRQDALVLADGAAARARAEEVVAAGYRGMGVDQLLVGGPDEAATRIDALGRLGFEQVIVRCVAAEQDLALETLELLGRVNQELGGP